MPPPDGVPRSICRDSCTCSSRSFLTVDPSEAATVTSKGTVSDVSAAVDGGTEALPMTAEPLLRSVGGCSFEVALDDTSGTGGFFAASLTSGAAPQADSANTPAMQRIRM